MQRHVPRRARAVSARRRECGGRSQEWQVGPDCAPCDADKRRHPHGERNDAWRRRTIKASGLKHAGKAPGAQPCGAAQHSASAARDGVGHNARDACGHIGAPSGTSGRNAALPRSPSPWTDTSGVTTEGSHYATCTTRAEREPRPRRHQETAKLLSRVRQLAAFNVDLFVLRGMDMNSSPCARQRNARGRTTTSKGMEARECKSQRTGHAQRRHEPPRGK